MNSSSALQQQMAADSGGAPKEMTIAPRPNVLLFLIDDMGYSDLAAYGSPNVSTPHIDGLIKSGVKFTSWISGAPICTPSRAALQTGRYPIRTGCMGNTQARRVIPTPSDPGGLDPTLHISIAAALRQVGYDTGMSGKWHLGINSHNQDRKFTPVAHGYNSYLGSPWTNAPMCTMDADGYSHKFKVGPEFCFMFANDTVVEMPLALENFTSAMTTHATDFIARQNASTPWFFFMSYFHVHSPLFTSKANQGRSKGGAFGDNIEELDDSVGAILHSLEVNGHAATTMVLLTSDNGPYQEEGWDRSGRVNLYASSRPSDVMTPHGGSSDAMVMTPHGGGGARIGRLRGGKAQLYEGGIRMPGTIRWPGVTQPNTIAHQLVSTMDIFPTVLTAANAMSTLPKGYVIDGKSLLPVLTQPDKAISAHTVLLLYCGFKPIAARVHDRYKLFWFTQKWYTYDPPDPTICTDCCNGVVPAGKLYGVNATDLCQCTEDALNSHEEEPLVYDLFEDLMEQRPYNSTSWPKTAKYTYAEIVQLASVERKRMMADVHPKPGPGGAGKCTAGLPAPSRQPCCPGCHKPLIGAECVHDREESKVCTCSREMKEEV